MKQSWFEGRFSHLDETGKPQPRFQECDENGHTLDTEQTYMTKPGEKRTLSTWKKMLEDNEITKGQLMEFQEEPWFDMQISSFHDIQGIEECSELLKTPAQQRKERGIDPKLTSQKCNASRILEKRRKAKVRQELRKPMRAEANKQMRELRSQGYSIAQISAQMIVPELGKKGSGSKEHGKFKKRLRDSLAKSMAKAKKAKAEKKETPEEAEVIR